MKVLLKTMEELKATIEVDEYDNFNGKSFTVDGLYCSEEMRKYLGKIVEFSEDYRLVDEEIPWLFGPEFVKAEIIKEKHIYVSKDGEEYVFDKAF